MWAPWAVLLCKFNDNDTEPKPLTFYEQLFTSAGCSGCHTLAAAGATAKVGPNLGKLGKVDAKFLRTSIEDPNADVTKGYKPNIMPQDFKKKLSKEEIDALVKYLLESQE